MAGSSESDDTNKKDIVEIPEPPDADPHPKIIEPEQQPLTVDDPANQKPPERM